MYAGKIVETGTVDEILLRPKHPYTEGLLTSIPSHVPRGQRLNVIRGQVPNPFRMPEGCRFEPRCPYAFEPCKPFEPALRDAGAGREVACWLQVPQAERPTSADVRAAAAPAFVGGGSVKPGGNR